MPVIATIKDLEAIYGRPNEASTVEVADRIKRNVRPPRPRAWASLAAVRYVLWA
jgi:hypothetical protein